jgi:hypothetical protein
MSVQSDIGVSSSANVRRSIKLGTLKSHTSSINDERLNSHPNSFNKTAIACFIRTKTSVCRPLAYQSINKKLPWAYWMLHMNSVCFAIALRVKFAL